MTSDEERWDRHLAAKAAARSLPFEDRLAAGRALADEAWAQTLRAMYDGGSTLYPIESDALDRRDQARQDAEDDAREEAGW